MAKTNTLDLFLLIKTGSTGKWDNSIRKGRGEKVDRDFGKSVGRNKK